VSQLSQEQGSPSQLSYDKDQIGVNTCISGTSNYVNWKNNYNDNSSNFPSHEPKKTICVLVSKT
jgi:hypothetical protein